jgi:hypothetical protein
MPTHSQPWPVVPRPFEGEAFGSWFGRIAARYRMRVDELACGAGLALDLCGGAWLASQPPQGEARRRLAELCRLPSEVIGSMAPQTSVVTNRFWYCYPCLDLNPQDVLSPYWRADWLTSGCSICACHQGDACWIELGTLLHCADMRSLVRDIRKRKQGWAQQRRREASRMYPYASAFRGNSKVDAKSPKSGH